MASVPEYERRVQLRAENQQGVNVRTSADTFGAQVGRAAEQVGVGMADAAAAIDYRDQLNADAEAREAYDNYRYDQREALRAPETGYLNRTGGNAAGAQQDAEAKLDDLDKRHGEGLSPRARKKYDALVGELKDQAHQSLLTHTSGESRNYIVNQRKSTISGYVEEAATNWNDEALFERNLGLALAEQTQLANLQGWDAASQERAAEELVSQTFRQRIILAATNDPIAAKELLDNSRDMLNAADEHALDTNLKQLVIDAKATRAVQPFVRRGGGGADPYLSSVTRAESGGNPNAANNKANPGVAAADGSASSALGPHQFLRGTYLGTVKELRAAGGAKWAEGLTDDEIAATRTDTAKEGEVFTFFREGNQKQLRAEGFEVTPVNEYALHHFGDGGGLALLRLARGKPGADLLEVFGKGLDAVLKANPQFKGKTAGEAYDWLASHLGADAKQAAGAPYFDGRAAIQAAMAIEDPEVQAAAMQKIANMMAMQDRANAQDRESAQKEAWDGYVQTGATNLPLEMRSRMGQAGWVAFQNAVKNDQQGVDVTDEQTWENLTRAASDPKSFVEINLEAHRANLTKSDYRSFVLAQEAARAALSKKALTTEQARDNMNFAKMFTAAEPVYEAIVDKTAPAKRSQEKRQQKVEFERSLMQLAKEFFDREKREPNTDEVRQMAAVMTLPVEFYRPDAGFWGGGPDGVNELGSGALFQAAQRGSDVRYRIAVEYDDIPIADRADIAAQLLRTTGALPSEEDVTEVYEQRQLMSVGLPPHVDVSTVPEWLKEAEKGVNPDVTDDELVELYQLYLMK